MRLCLQLVAAAPLAGESAPKRALPSMHFFGAQDFFAESVAAPHDE